MKKILKRFLFKIKNRKKAIVLKKGCNVGFNSTFEGCNSIGRESDFSGNIGFGSYMGANCHINGKIGKYCSIAEGVNVVIGDHPTKTFVSTHPAFFSTKKQAGFCYVEEMLFQEQKYADGEKNCVVIGNDVWIGYGVTILSGVTIGDGAIIGAGALVNKDIPPYAIAVGIPAKVIKYRFNEDQIKSLLEFKWWEKPEEWIKKNADLFTDAGKMIELIRAENEDQY